MRVGVALLRKKSRMPQREPIPFQELLPLKLKNSISGKKNQVTKVSCIQEMAVMFSCLKTNEFNQELCSKEISGFQKCYTDHLAADALKAEQAMKGVLTPGERSMGFRQVNQILQQFPALRPTITHNK